MAIRFLTFISLILSAHLLNAMENPLQSTGVIIKPKINTFIQPDSKSEQAAKALAQERVKVLENAFKHITKAPPNGKSKLSSQDLRKKLNSIPLVVQQHIGKMWLRLTVTNTIKEYTKELLPAVLDHSAITHEETIFSSIDWAEKTTSKILHLIDRKKPVELVLAVYCTQDDAPKIDPIKQDVLNVLKETRHVCFSGIKADNDAFIMHRYIDGSTRFFINSRNRAILHGLNKEQLDYIIALFNQEDPKKWVQKNKKIHRSLPITMQALIEDNYNVTSTSSCSPW